MIDHPITPLEKSIQSITHSDNVVSYDLYDGIKLAFMTLTGDQRTDIHEPLDHILEINYCYKGRMGWKMSDGNSFYLDEHDFSIHTMDCCARSTITLPNEYYEGLTIYIDLDNLSNNAPALLKNTGITGTALLDKFCQNDGFSALIGNQDSDAIFSAFYDQPEALQFVYWRLKVIELLLYLSKFPMERQHRLTEYQSEQVEVIRNIHQYLLDNLHQRITIEELASQFLINPTTLKSVFKAVYGTSIASHISEHRMQAAARLLTETPKSIKEIANAVGYESQSKFSKVFKEYYDVIPTEYRNLHTQH